MISRDTDRTELGIGHLSIGGVGVWGIKELTEVYNKRSFFSDAQLLNINNDI